MELLTREDFRSRVFARDFHTCVVPGCMKPAEDAHHIIERGLWPDGGYYLENGASLCDLNGKGHHMDAEQNLILPQQLRDWIGIDKIALPPDWDDYLQYNKWGDILWTGKHPRTYHFPSSPGSSSDDKILQTVSQFNGIPLIVSEKMDGENTTMTRDHIHARSIDSETHSSQGWVRNLWGQIRWDIPKGMRITGENLYATHSIFYDDLPSYFMVHGVWDGEVNLPHEEACEWAELLGLEMAPMMEHVTTDSILDLVDKWAAWQKHYPDTVEGFVIRYAGPIHVSEYKHLVGKWVRAGHVTTMDHGWRFRNDYQVNGLA
jgi:hypothetical protein